MGLFGKKKNEGGLMDAIRCDQEDYFIWKWSPEGNEEANTTKKENAIRYGSSLNVKDGEVAAFVYHQKDGTQQDFIVGPYNDTIKTANFPILANIVGLAFGGSTPFQAEVYYINLAGIIQVKFAVPYFDIFDPRLQDFPIPVSVRGSFAVAISDYREFVKLHRLSTFDMEKFKTEVKDALIKYVKGVAINIPDQYGIPVVQIERRILEINQLVEGYVKPKLESTYGVLLRSFDISTIEIDKTSDGWQKVSKMTAGGTEGSILKQQELNLKTMDATTNIQLDNMKQSAAIQMENMAETMRANREEAKFAQHAQTEANLYAAKLNAEQANIGAFGIKTQGQVGVAAANAMGSLGQAGNVNLGGSGASMGGMNPGAMMANMAMGQSIGMGMANMMGNSFGQMNQNFGSAGGLVPPVPGMGEKSYNLAVNGVSTGPFTLSQIQQMVSAGQVNAQTMVWSNGMANWTAAGQVSELAGLFGGMPPVPPVPPPLG